ncbi:MAG: hypothetical protein AAF413_02835 [Patescibacteria group bacterium]
MKTAQAPEYVDFNFERGQFRQVLDLLDQAADTTDTKRFAKHLRAVRTGTQVVAFANRGARNGQKVVVVGALDPIEPTALRSVPDIDGRISIAGYCNMLKPFVGITDRGNMFTYPQPDVSSPQRESFLVTTGIIGYDLDHWPRYQCIGEISRLMRQLVLFDGDETYKRRQMAQPHRRIGAIQMDELIENAREQYLAIA